MQIQEISVTAGVRCSEKWILDSACSYQRCPHKEFFSTYEPGYVDMGNNAVCKTVGFGTVELKMHDGMTRTLTGVRHVPDLRKNLVSFSVLSEEGCRFSGDAEVLKVCKGALVVMKAKRVGKLYVLQGATLSGFSFIIICVEAP